MMKLLPLCDRAKWNPGQYILQIPLFVFLRVLPSSEDIALLMQRIKYLLSCKHLLHLNVCAQFFATINCICCISSENRGREFTLFYVDDRNEIGAWGNKVCVFLGFSVTNLAHLSYSLTDMHWCCCISTA